MTDNVELKKAILTPNGDLRAVDYSGTIELIPRTWGLLAALGLFEDRFGTQKTFFMGRKEEVEAPLLEDRNWEGTRPTLTREGESGALFKVPHFPVDDMILPNDIDGRFVWDNTFRAGTELDSVSRVRIEKMERLRKTHAQTHEWGRALALVTGDVYAPRGTLKTSYGPTVNAYQEWGITRQSHALRVGTGIDPQESVDELVGKLQDVTFDGEELGGYIVICSPEMFAKVSRNAYIKDIYAAALLAGRQELLVGRLGNDLGLDSRYRTFRYADIDFIEYRATINGQRIIPANEGVALPRKRVGRQHFAPANRFATINQMAQGSYFWERLGEDDDKLILMTETNFATILDRPDQVLTVTLDETPAP